MCLWFFDFVFALKYPHSLTMDRRHIQGRSCLNWCMHWNTEYDDQRMSGCHYNSCARECFILASLKKENKTIRRVMHVLTHKRHCHVQQIRAWARRNYILGVWPSRSSKGFHVVCFDLWLSQCEWRVRFSGRSNSLISIVFGFVFIFIFTCEICINFLKYMFNNCVPTITMECDCALMERGYTF